MVDKPNFANDPAITAKAEDMRSDLEQLRSDLTSLADTIAKSARENAKSVASDAKAAASQVGDLAGDQYVQVRDRIREQPMTACAIAIGVGILLGQMLRR